MDFSTMLKAYKFSDKETLTKKRRTEETKQLVRLDNINRDNRTTIISVYFLCNEGSVTHYYHFLLGALVPLIEYHISTSQVKTYRICTDIGPMKRVLCELPLNIIDIAGPVIEKNNLRAHDDQSLYSGLVLKDGEVRLPAYDIFNSCFYMDDSYPRLSRKTRSSVTEYIVTNIPFYIRSIPTKSILLIERTVELDYLDVSNSLSKVYMTSGSERRLITNHADLVNTLALKYGDDFINLSLERCSLYYQAHMFNNARIVIAQHDAALTNIFFMRPSTNVIEISPPWSKSFHHFRNLSHFCNLNYDVINQHSDESEVDIDLIVHKIDEITRTWRK